VCVHSRAKMDLVDWKENRNFDRERERRRERKRVKELVLSL